MPNQPLYLTRKVIYTDEQLNIELNRRGLNMLEFKDYVALKSRGKYGRDQSFYKVYRAHVGAMPQRDGLTLRDWKRIIFWAGEFAESRGHDWGFSGGAVQGVRGGQMYG